MEKLLLKDAEAAEALGVTVQYLRGMIRRGELLTVEVGKTRRIPVDALRKWISERVAATVTQPPSSAHVTG